jgi:predicted nucleic acid-binding protein
MSEPSAIVCVDTQVLIWGIKEDATPGQESMIEKAKHFFGRATESGETLLIPSVVVGELLMRVPPALHTMILNLIQRGFITAPYDLEAAAIFARLWQERKDDGVIEELLQNGATRSELKADCQIVATALAAGATSIISHDTGVRRFAGDEIAVSELPAGVKQLAFLQDEDQEIALGESKEQGG